MKTRLFPSAVVLILVLLLIPGMLWADDWTTLTPVDAPAARHGHSMVTLPDGRVMLFGGADEEGNCFNDLHAFDGNNWAPLPVDPAPPARRDHAAWYANSKMYVSSGKGPAGPLSDLWYYDLQASSWQEVGLPGDKPAARYGHTATLLDDGSVLIHGGVNSAGDPLSDLWKYDPFGNTFTRLTDSNRSHYHHTATLDRQNGRLVVPGPFHIDSYSLISESWSFSFTALPLTGMHSAADGLNESGKTVIFLFGGLDNYGNTSDKVYELDINTLALTQRPDPMPHPVANGATAKLLIDQRAGGVTGRSNGGPELVKVLLFGGLTGDVPTNDTLLFRLVKPKPFGLPWMQLLLGN